MRLIEIAKTGITKNLEEESLEILKKEGDLAEVKTRFLNKMIMMQSMWDSEQGLGMVIILHRILERQRAKIDELSKLVGKETSTFKKVAKLTEKHKQKLADQLNQFLEKVDERVMFGTIEKMKRGRMADKKIRELQKSSKEYITLLKQGKEVEELYPKIIRLIRSINRSNAKKTGSLLTGLSRCIAKQIVKTNRLIGFWQDYLRRISDRRSFSCEGARKTIQKYAGHIKSLIENEKRIYEKLRKTQTHLWDLQDVMVNELIKVLEKEEDIIVHRVRRL